MSSSSAPGLMALSSTLLGLSFLAVALRFYARQKQKAQFKSDDWIMIPCIFLFLATTACTFYGLYHKVLGYPTPKNPKDVAKTAEMLSKLYIVFDLFSIATLGCVKISALLFYRRIFCVHGRRSLFNALTIVTIVIVALWTVGYLMLTGLACGTHFSALWTSRKDYHKYCRAEHPYLLSLSISDFVLDIWILNLPIPQIWVIRTTLRRKIAITGAFLLAFAGLGACIARMAVYIQIDNGTIPTIDTRLINSKSVYLTVLETGLSLIAVNLPSLWSLFSELTPEKVLQSVRSIISLRSGNSSSFQRGEGSWKSTSHLDKRGNSSSSHSHIIPPDAPYNATFATHDQEHENHGSDLPLGKIEVIKSLSYTATQV